MNYNNLSRITPRRRTFGLIVLILLIIPLISWGVLFFLLPYLTSSPQLASYSPRAIIAALAVIVAVFSIALKFIEYVLNNQFTSERKIELKVDVQGMYAIITCTIENMGRKRIIPKNIYIFIDEGIEEDNGISFPFCLKHEEGDFDCVLSKKCKQGGLNSFPVNMLPDEYKNKFHKSFKLEHLSREAILFIDPGEKFSEDKIIKFNDYGIYRVMAVWTSVNADCLCTTKQFIVHPNKGKRK